MKRLTPQEKKALSYQKDCRNVYGENDKSSRKAIRKNKIFSIRKERRQLDASAKEEAQGLGHALTPRRNKQAWKKLSDRPLGKIVPNKLKYRQTDKYRAKIKRRENPFGIFTKLID